MKAENIAAEFAPNRVPYPGGLLLLDGPHAVALVERAAEEGVPILGVSCRPLSAERAPDPICEIADFSASVAKGHGCWAEAEKLILSRAVAPCAFEVVLGDDPVEAV